MLHSHPPASSVDTEALLKEEEKCIRILSLFNLELGADLVMHTPHAPALQNGVSWKVMTFPFYAVAGVMGIILGGLRLGA